MANLITNGDFTAGSAAGWNYGSRTYIVNDGGCDTGVYPDGMVVFQNESQGGMLQIGQNVSGMVAGRTYTLSFYAKRIGRYDAWAGYDYWELNGTGKTVHFASKESELRENQWVKLTYQFVWPSGVQPTACIRIRAGADAVNGWTTLLVDKVVLDDGQGGGGTTDPTIGPHTANNTALTGAALTQNAQCVYNYLRAKGWTKNAVCAILGNMQLESTINPGRYGGNGTNINVFGLVQWRPGTKYTNWAAQNGYPAVSMKGQLERLLWEVRNPGPSGADQWYATSEYNLSFAQFTTSTQTPEWLAKAFLFCYERASSGTQNTRATYARNWYNTFA